MIIHLASLPTLIAFVLNLYLLMLAITQDYRKRVSHIFTVLISLFLIWDFFEFALRNSGFDAPALVFAKLTWIAVAFIPPVYLNFALVFPREKRILRNKLVYAIIYFPAFIVAYLVCFSDSFIVGTIPILFGNARTIIYGPYLNFYSVYAYPVFFAGLLLLFQSWKNSKSKRERLQGKWMFYASLIPIVGGSITNVVLPSMGFQVFPLASTFMVIMSLLIAKAITKFRIISVTPGFAAETIIAMIPHGILLLDQEQKILYINKILLDALGYTRVELIGQPAKKILHEDERFFGLAWQTVDENKVLEKSKVQFLSKNKEAVPFYFSGAVAMDGDEAVGFIGLGTPIENTKNQRVTNEK